MREFLKEQGLEDEKVESIMAEYGKKIESFKAEIDAVNNQLQEYKTNEEKSTKQLEKYKSQIDDLNKSLEEKDKSLESLQDVTNENYDLKAQIQMTDANVKKEFSKFVANEVKEMVNEDTDFTKALASYKKENPQYFGDTVIKKVQTSPNLSNGGQKEVTTSDIMNNLLRGNR